MHIVLLIKDNRVLQKLRTESSYRLGSLERVLAGWMEMCWLTYRVQKSAWSPPCYLLLFWHDQSFTWFNTAWMTSEQFSTLFVWFTQQWTLRHLTVTCYEDVPSHTKACMRLKCASGTVFLAYWVYRFLTVKGVKLANQAVSYFDYIVMTLEYLQEYIV